MKTYPVTIAAGMVFAAFTMLTGMAAAHHAEATMFDRNHPMEVTGTVKEFRYKSPHVGIVLEIKGTDGAIEVWYTEGPGPGALDREGWNAGSPKPGDVVRMTVDPLHSGAPGAAWSLDLIHFLDGKPIVPKE
jgi:hypothetical protein